MPRFYFKLVDGAHDLEHETAAQIAAIELARSIRQEDSNSSDKLLSIAERVLPITINFAATESWHRRTGANEGRTA
jgi:hypothetical protein